MHTEYDSIVVGSGLGGLATALCLSKAGQKVLVLEQHYVPGGWCHSFYLNGHRFSPGVHYVGQMEKGESTSLLFEALGIANDLVFFRMNPTGYEHCHIGNEKIDMPANRERLYEALSQKFPHERKNLKKFLTLVQQVADEVQLIPKMKGLWDLITIPFRTRHMGKYGLFSLKTVIDWHIKDPLLKAILNVQCGDHGLPPELASFPVHCVVMNHYFNGGYYPMGGGGAIVKALTKAIQKNGGTIATQKNVKEILLAGEKKKKAIGVQLSTGEKIFAKRIISNADPQKTFELTGLHNISNKLNERLSKTKYSMASLFLFLSVDMDMRKAGMDSGNVWIIKDADFHKVFMEMKTMNLLEEEEFPALFIGCSTLKDPTSFNGKTHDIEVVTFIDYESFAAFNTGNDYHSMEYSIFKKKIQDKIMKSMERTFPGITSCVKHIELGTPKTSEFYINSTRGNVYGTEKNFRQTGPFSYSPKTEIENLFMCGASIVSHGVSGALNSGVVTAAQILSIKTEKLLEPQSGQHLRIYDAEDDSQWPDGIKQKISDRKRRNSQQNNSLKKSA